MNCALANREILGHYAQRVFREFFAGAELPPLFDVSHNTCKVESHVIGGRRRELFVHRKGATRAFGADPRQPAAGLAANRPACLHRRQHGNGVVRSRRRGLGGGESLRFGVPRRRAVALSPCRSQAV